jgi:serine/threonine-protein kinase RIO1
MRKQPRTTRVEQEIRASVEDEKKAIEDWAKKQRKAIESWVEKEKKSISTAVERGVAKVEKGKTSLAKRGRKRER